MRDIKFRAWNKETNCFFMWNLSFAFGGTGELWGDVQQYTGLKDKNGKEIYEGDICSVDGGENIYEIIFYMGGFMVAVLPSKIRIYHIGDSLFNNIEVIGNIHENPELLK